jgi:hypothetical protein
VALKSVMTTRVMGGRVSCSTMAPDHAGESSTAITDGEAEHDAQPLRRYPGCCQATLERITL